MESYVVSPNSTLEFYVDDVVMIDNEDRVQVEISGWYKLKYSAAKFGNLRVFVK